MQNSDHNTRYGVVIFDDPDKPALGWASLAGSKPRKIFQLTDLESDGIFISNLSFNQLRAINALKEPRIRASNFFREELTIISNDLGLPIYESPETCINALSEFFDRSIRIMLNIYSVDRLDASLKETISKKIFNKQQPETFGSPKIDEAINESYLAMQRCYSTNSSGARNVKIRYSRSYYCANLMRMPMPVGPWEVVTSNLPKNERGCRKGIDCGVYKQLQLIGDKRPAFCQVSVTNINLDVAPLLAFTNGTLRRNWVPIHEAAFLAQIAEVKVNALIIGAKYERLQNTHLNWQDSGAIADVSYSAGLVAENHISAISSGSKKRSGGVIYSPRASYIRAWDRIFMFKAARTFHEHDISVASYAMGAVNLSVLDNQIGKVFKLSLEMGLTPPATLLKAFHEDEKFIEDDVTTYERYL